MESNALFLYCSALARDAAVQAMPPASFVENHRTFSEFVDELDRWLPLESPGTKAARVGSAREIPSGTGRTALLLQAARDAKAEDLTRVAGSLRAIESAGNLISAWKGLQLRPADIRAASAAVAADPGTARPAATLSKLAALYEHYELRLGAEWTDRESRERALLRRLQACSKLPSRLLEAGAKVVLVGFHRLAYFQRRVVTNLIRLKVAVEVRAPLPMQKAGETVAEFPGLRETFSGATFAEPSRAPVQALRIEAPTPYAEVYEIGRRVRQWINSGEVHPSEIAVAFRDLGGYSQAVHDVFTRLHIPFYERRGEPAAFQPLVRVALSAIDASVEGLTRRGVFRFLCAGPVYVAAISGEQQPVDPFELNALAIDAGIENFYGDDAAAPAAAWRARIDAYLLRKEKRTSKRDEAGKRKALTQSLLAVIERLEALRADRSATAFALAWKSFFQWNATPAFTSKERLALDALTASLNEIAEGPGARTETITLKEFSELLGSALQQRSIQFEGTNRAGVRVLNFYDLRGLSFARVAIGGLSDGQCPAPKSCDALLGSGYEREVRSALSKQLNDSSAGAHLQPRFGWEHDEEERALFGGAVGCAHEQLLLARSLKSLDGAQLGASEYWENFSGPVERCASIHPAPPLESCLTNEERELRAAWILGGGANHDLTERSAAWAEYEGGGRLPSLARGAAIEQKRLSEFQALAIKNAPGEKVEQPTPDGAATNPETLERTTRKLAPDGIGDPLLSPSDIENLAQCPFKFFAEKICRLDSSEEPGEELSPLEVGSLWHRILARFYSDELKRARSLGRVCAQLTPYNREFYLNRLEFIAGEELVLTEKKTFTGHPGFWRLHQQRVRGVLSRWLDCELQTPTDGFHPALVEFEFGPEAGPGGGVELVVPLAMTDASGNAPALRVKGRMDRLDLKLETQGGKTTVVGLRIIDYKTGTINSYTKKTKKESLEKLLDAQLPIYLAAGINHLAGFCAERHVGIDFERVWSESRAGYYSIKDTPKCSREKDEPTIQIKDWPLGDMREFIDLRAPAGSKALFDLVRQSVTRALSGNFPVQPQACAGSLCPARVVCRYVDLPVMGGEE